MNSARRNAEVNSAGEYSGSTPYVNRPSRQSNGNAGYGAPTLVPAPFHELQDTSPGDLAQSVMLGNMVGRSAAMQEVFSMIRLLAPSSASVLITGQSGTGKELVAREIHNCSTRRDGPFVAINAAALPESLTESELFGHEKGAFTGAVERHAGCFEQAHGGTLFLDELGEMPLSVQPILLRVLETMRVRRLGGRNDVSVDVRVLAATSQPVATHLRDDIFYRLSVFHILLPPLRARSEDIPLLADVMVQSLNQKNGTLVTGIDSEVLNVFKTYAWPGNARELRNVIERATIIAGTGPLHLGHLPATLFAESFAARRQDAGSMTLLPGKQLAEVEEAYIALTLQHVSNNVAAAAALLGLSPRTVRNRMAMFQSRRTPQTRADDMRRLTQARASDGWSIGAAKAVGA